MILGILSGKGGVGKTTVVSNLATVLSKALGKSVIIVDSSITTTSLSHICLHFGLNENLKETVRGYLDSKTPLRNVVYTHSPSGVKVIPAPLVLYKQVTPAGFKKFMKWLSYRGLRKLTQKLEKEYDYVLVDCPPGIGAETVYAIDAIDEAIVVTTPEIPDVSDALRTINYLKSSNKKIHGVIINKIRNKKYELSINELKETFDAPIMSTIGYDDNVPEAISKGMPSYLHNKNSKVSKEFTRLVGNLTGEEINIGWWEVMRNFFRFR